MDPDRCNPTRLAPCTGDCVAGNSACCHDWQWTQEMYYTQGHKEAAELKNILTAQLRGASANPILSASTQSIR